MEKTYSKKDYSTEVKGLADIVIGKINKELKNKNLKIAFYDVFTFANQELQSEIKEYVFKNFKKAGWKITEHSEEKRSGGQYSDGSSFSMLYLIFS